MTVLTTVGYAELRGAQSPPLRVPGPRWLARHAVSARCPNASLPLPHLSILRTERILLLSRCRCCSRPLNFIDPLQPQASSAWLCWGQAIRCGSWESSSLQHSVKHRALNPQLSAIIILFQFPSTLPARQAALVQSQRAALPGPAAPLAHRKPNCLSSHGRIRLRPFIVTFLPQHTPHHHQPPYRSFVFRHLQICIEGSTMAAFHI